VVGCNYWAAHAGTNMWRDWRPEVVDRDLARLSGAGLQILRVFPRARASGRISSRSTNSGKKSVGRRSADLVKSHCRTMPAGSPECQQR